MITRFIKIALLGILLSTVVSVASAAARVTVDVAAQYPGAPGPCTAPCTVNLTATTSPADHPISSYQWTCNYTSGGPPFNPGGQTHSCTYTTPDSYHPAVRVVDATDGTTSGDAKYVQVASAADAPADIGYNGPTAFKVPTTIWLTTPKSHLTVYADQGSVAVGPSVRQGNVNAYPVRIEFARLGTVQLYARAWSFDPSYTDYRQFTVSVTGWPGPFTGYRSAFSQGAYAKATVYRASSLVRGYAAKSHTCSGFVRLERKVGRKWKPYKSKSAQCKGSGSYSQEFVPTDLYVRMSTLKTAVRHYKVRVVAQVRIAASGRTIYQQKVTKPVTAQTLRQQYKAIT